MYGELMTTGRVADFIRFHWSYVSENAGINVTATDPFDINETRPDTLRRFMTGLASYATQYMDLCLTDVPLEASNCSWTCTA